MELHLNDLSICGQFANPESFRVAIQPILEFRRQYSYLSRRLYCSRSLSMRPATSHHTVQEAVLAINDQNFKGLVLRWLGAGPFWDDECTENPDDYFHFEGEDVTLQGLGEAARRILVQIDAGSFSLIEGAIRFERTPLNVIHGLEEEPLAEIPVPGIWNPNDLPATLTLVPDSWPSLLNEAAARFNLLWFYPRILEPLEKIPFDAIVADRALALFAILQTVAAERNTDGSLSKRGIEIWQQYSVGDNAYFTDESDKNKVDFRDALTFRDTEFSGNVMASWHGKIKHRQFRIHFEWPMRADVRQVRIFFLGPKITKH